MADNTGTLIKVGLIGAAGYWAYTQGWLSFLGLTPTAAATTTPAPVSVPTPSPVVSAPPVPPAPPAPAVTPPAPVPSVLDGIFARIQSAAGNVQLDPDNWGWYLNNELQALGKPAAPDPVPLFGQRPFTAMSAAQWWGPMSQALKTQLGLSGLGIYGGLAGLAAYYSHRRAS